MALESRIESLEQRHQQLEGELHEKLQQPGIDTTEINELKRQKLVLKDTIQKLLEANGSLH